MLQSRKRMFSVVVVVVLAAFSLTSTTFAQEPDDTPSVSVSNSYVRIDATSHGVFIIGTTGGNPDIASDDDKRLLYGFEPGGSGAAWSSYTTFRVADGGTPRDYATHTLSTSGYVTSPSAAVAGSIVTSWTLPEGVFVKQTLTPIENPFSGREDMVRIAYTLTNQDSVAHIVGVRCMLDVMIGENDAAPYFVPGVGNSDKGQQYDTGSIPSYYYAFESATYEADSLKGQGILSGFGMTEPDRFLITSWPDVYSEDVLWDHTVEPEEENGDSAVVMYWNPRSLAPGQSVTYVTAYGLAGEGGDASWVSAPILVTDRTSTFEVTVWVNNSASGGGAGLAEGLALRSAAATDWIGGEAVISLPAGLQLHAGESASKTIGDVPAGTVGEASWMVDIVGGPGTYSYSVTTTFASGTEPLLAEGEITVIESGPGIYLPLVLRN